jgi:ABC-type transporter Mla subunit MlaD
MWFFNRNRENLAKLEDKVAELEDKLNQQYDEYDAMSESLDNLCKELRDFLTEENTTVAYDIQQKQDGFEVVRQDRETGTQDR